MDDKHIVELYWARDEAALYETDLKYRSYLQQISYGILGLYEDARECVNDTYSHAWNAMPPHRPAALSTFLGKITRRISIDRWRRQTAEKRGGSQIPLALEELSECVSGTGSVEDELLRRELAHRLNTFLQSLPAKERRVFLCRYWYLDPVADIALQFGFSQSKVASMLRRTRLKLRAMLEQEGYYEK